MASVTTLRKQYVSKAKSYEGARKGSKKHAKIIKIFNTVKPDGWAMTLTAPWCATAVSAWAIKLFGALKAKKVFPLSANCNTMIAKAKKMGTWMERNRYRPSPGDLCIFTWSGSQSTSSHVGVVIGVSGIYVTTMEGNKGTSSVVGRRTFPIGWGYIRGYVVPKYSAIATGSNKKKKAKTVKYKVKSARGLNVRTGAGTTYRVKTAIVNGTTVRISKTKNGWGYSPALKGWLSMKFLKKS